MGWISDRAVRRLLSVALVVAAVVSGCGGTTRTSTSTPTPAPPTAVGATDNAPSATSLANAVTQTLNDLSSCNDQPAKRRAACVRPLVRQASAQMDAMIAAFNALPASAPGRSCADAAEGLSSKLHSAQKALANLGAASRPGNLLFARAYGSSTDGALLEWTGLFDLCRKDVEGSGQHFQAPPTSTGVDPEAASIGDTVPVTSSSGQTVAVTLIAIERWPGPTDGPPPVGSAYWAVRLKLADTAGTGRVCGPKIAVLTPDDGDDAKPATMVRTPALGCGTMAPGDTRKGWVTYQLPGSQKPTTVLVQLDPEDDAADPPSFTSTYSTSVTILGDGSSTASGDASPTAIFYLQ